MTLTHILAGLIGFVIGVELNEFINRMLVKSKMELNNSKDKLIKAQRKYIYAQQETINLLNLKLDERNRHE